MKIIGIIPVMPTKQTFVMDRKLIGFGKVDIITVLYEQPPVIVCDKI